MPTSTEIFINSELPKRPYTNQFPLTLGHVPVATGVGLQVEARALTTSDISGMSSYATQNDLSNVLAGLWDDRGAYTVNAAGNINYPSSAGSGVAGALMKGDIFTVAGAVTGVSTINNIAVNNGDTVRALVDNPSATDNAHWAIAENNIGYVPENRANKTTSTDLSGATGTYPDTPTVKSYIDKYDISAASISSTGTVTLTRTASDLTFQVPTAVSGLSFDANTGVLTSSYTNNATSTTITVAANEVSDNVFRIKDNDDATKKIAFEASGIAAGETRTITMPNADVDLGNVAQAASASTAGYLTSADWSTFNGKQAALADVITADTYGSSTQYPVITLNAKGIATGVTLQTVPTPTFTDATFKVQKNGSPSIAASWDLTSLTTSRVHTYPNKAINFGDLPSVATTDSNNLSGTRNRILGGNNTALSGTDNIAIGCSDSTSISGSGRVVAISANRFNTLSTAAFAPNSIVLGTSAYDPSSAIGGPYVYAGAVGVQTTLCTHPVTASGSTYSLTSDGENPTSTNCLPALLYGGSTFMSARHEFDIIIVFGEDFAILPSRTFYAKRTVYVARRITSGIPLNVTPVLEMSTATPQPDVTLGLGSNTVTINFTLDSANNRLIPTVAVTTSAGFQRMQVSCRVESHYNRK